MLFQRKSEITTTIILQISPATKTQRETISESCILSAFSSVSIIKNYILKFQKILFCRDFFFFFKKYF